MLAELGITAIHAQSPQAKSRIERLWQAFQDQLSAELRLAGARDLAAATAVLETFLPTAPQLRSPRRGCSQKFRMR